RRDCGVAAGANEPSGALPCPEPRPGAAEWVYGGDLRTRAGGGADALAGWSVASGAAGAAGVAACGRRPRSAGDRAAEIRRDGAAVGTANAGNAGQGYSCRRGAGAAVRTLAGRRPGSVPAAGTGRGI